MFIVFTRTIGTAYENAGTWGSLEDAREAMTRILDGAARTTWTPENGADAEGIVVWAPRAQAASVPGWVADYRFGSSDEHRVLRREFGVEFLTEGEDAGRSILLGNWRMDD